MYVEPNAKLRKMVKVRSAYRADYDDLNGDTWEVRLQHVPSGRTMSLRFTQGYGWNGARPKVESIVKCIMSDYRSAKNWDTLDDIVSDYGWDSFSSVADIEKLFKAVKRQAAKMERCFGDDMSLIDAIVSEY